MKELTIKQERFCLAYMRTGVASEAYRRSFGVTADTLPSTIHRSAHELLQHEGVKARLAELRDEAAKGAVIEQVDVLLELRRLAMSDVRLLMDETGKVLIPSELDPETAAAVQSFKIDEYGRIEYKFHDKLGALEKLAKYLGLYEKDNRQKADPLLELLGALNGNVVGAVRPGAAGGEDD